ncbi:hypothetical protein BH23PLA1_BH23PLA1_24890 [soil metagenome]
MRNLRHRLDRIEAAIDAFDPSTFAYVRGKLANLAFRLTLHGPRNAQERGALELLTEAAGKHWRDRFLELIGEDPNPKHRIAHRTGRTDTISERAAKLLIERGRWDILERYDRPSKS